MSEHDDVWELTDADFARARPFKEVFPAQHESWKRRVGRPGKRSRPEMADEKARKEERSTRTTGPVIDK